MLLLAEAPEPVTLGVMGGEIDGTFMRVATDLTSVLNSPALRVLPIVGKGSLQNLSDLIRLPGVDLAFVASDVLAYAHAHNLFPGKLERIQYICKLYDNDVHVLAGSDIKTLHDLDGKPFNIDVEGSGTNLTLRTICTTLGVQPQFHTDEPTIALTKLQQNDIAALGYVVGKPARLFVGNIDKRLHFVSVPYDPRFGDTYLPSGALTHADYPGLIGENVSVETIGVGVTLAVFSWPPKTPRYNNLVKFTDAFFDSFQELLKPPHHPKWREVNLFAQQPGWTRFEPATAWLNAHVPATRQSPADSTIEAQFDEFLRQRGISLNPGQRAAMFSYFQTKRLR
jgi:TRAP-type uncharacterized transport system substrate-binding protein